MAKGHGYASATASSADGAEEPHTADPIEAAELVMRLQLIGFWLSLVAMSVRLLLLLLIDAASAPLRVFPPPAQPLPPAPPGAWMLLPPPQLQPRERRGLTRLEYYSGIFCGDVGHMLVQKWASTIVLENVSMFFPLGIHFGLDLGPSWGPSWDQVGTKN